MGTPSDPKALVERLATALDQAGLPGLAAAWLFGSHAEGRAHRESDVDIGVLFDRSVDAGARFDAKVLLAGVLPGVARAPVDVVIVNDAPPQFARRIVIDGRRILVRDPEVEHAFRRDVQLRAADIEPFLRWTRKLKLEWVRR